MRLSERLKRFFIGSNESTLLTPEGEEEEVYEEWAIIEGATIRTNATFPLDNKVQVSYINCLFTGVEG